MASYIMTGSVPSCVKIAVTDDAYARMMAGLKRGEPFVKTFIGTCPHRSKHLCNCSFYKNTLVGDEIMREMNGNMEKIWSMNQIMELHKKELKEQKNTRK